MPQIPRLAEGPLAILFAPLGGAPAAPETALLACIPAMLGAAGGAAIRNDNKTVPRGGGNDSQRSEEIWQRKPDRNVLAASEQFTSQHKS